MSLIYMKKKSLGVDELDDSGILEALKFRFLQASQRIPMLKFKAPKAVVEHTPTSVSFDTLENAVGEVAPGSAGLSGFY